MLAGLQLLLAIPAAAAYTPAGTPEVLAAFVNDWQRGDPVLTCDSHPRADRATIGLTLAGGPRPPGPGSRGGLASGESIHSSSSILRGPPEEREANLALLVADLKKVAAHQAFRSS